MNPPLPLRVAPALLLIAALAPRPRTLPPAPPRRPLCVTLEEDRLVATDCAAIDMRFEDERGRTAAGLPICWWTASRARFTGISGVGTATARRLVEARDEGRWPDAHTLRAVRGVGATTAARIVTAVETDCHGPDPR